MGMTILAFEGESPRIHKTAYLADGVAVIGRVEIGGKAGIWFNAVLRGDAEPIWIGRGTNVQDGTVMHTDPGYPCRVEDFVTVGHSAILHGCTVEQGATIGMGGHGAQRGPRGRGGAGGGQCPGAGRDGDPTPDAGGGCAGQAEAGIDGGGGGPASEECGVVHQAAGGLFEGEGKVTTDDHR